MTSQCSAPSHPRLRPEALIASLALLAPSADARPAQADKVFGP